MPAALTSPIAQVSITTLRIDQITFFPEDNAGAGTVSVLVTQLDSNGNIVGDERGVESLANFITAFQAAVGPGAKAKLYQAALALFGNPAATIT